MRSGLGCSAGLALAGALGPGCASAQPAPDPPPAFVFQNSPWVNLHHLLRAEARREVYAAELVVATEGLGAEERRAWRAALDAYRGLAERSLLHDEGLVRINVALAGLADARELPPDLLDPPLAAALAGAAPIYRERVWPAQQRVNDAWIERTARALEPHAAALVAALAEAYRIDWPAVPVLIDVTPETGRMLAYTTQAAPPGFAGLATIAPVSGLDVATAVELVLHEASHVVDHELVAMIDGESARQGLEPPPELWHAVLTLTAGELVRRELGAAGTYRADLGRDHPAYLPALERNWQAYLDGEVSLERALTGLVREAAAAVP